MLLHRSHHRQLASSPLKIDYFFASLIRRSSPRESYLGRVSQIIISYQVLWRRWFSSSNNLENLRVIAKTYNISGFDFELICRTWDNFISISIGGLSNILCYLDEFIIVAYILSLLHFYRIVDHLPTIVIFRSSPREWNLSRVSQLIISR